MTSGSAVPPHWSVGVPLQGRPVPPAQLPVLCGHAGPSPSLNCRDAPYLLALKMLPPLVQVRSLRWEPGLGTRVTGSGPFGGPSGKTECGSVHTRLAHSSASTRVPNRRLQRGAAPRGPLPVRPRGSQHVTRVPTCEQEGRTCPHGLGASFALSRSPGPQPRVWLTRTLRGPDARWQACGWGYLGP